ncbi:MAG: SDR family NAD(P)-dependent oxidoreductase [Crocinitomicaceae bacterium]|nr:SDR family NAD(P)-dependent oxidoreductase [Crocinitomicaceae bacterium]
MEDKIVVMTGGSSGLGLAAAEQLLKKGVKLLLLHRASAKITSLSQYSNLIAIPCDLSSFDQIKYGIEKIKSLTDSVDVLINNAGIWVFGEKELSEDSIELTWQVNVLAPFLLMNGLLPLLEKAHEPIVINTASGLHQGDIFWDDPTFEKNSFSGFKAYRQSKLAIILLTIYFAEQWHEKVKVVSMHPGVVSTNLANKANWFVRCIFLLIGKSPEKGADTLIYLTENIKAAQTGGYYVNKKLRQTTTAQSKDMQIADRLVRMIRSRLPL